MATQTANPLPSADQLLPELKALRVSGLAAFDVQSVPHLARMAIDAGYTKADDVTVAGLKTFLQSAAGTLDDDRLESPVARLFGLGLDQSISDPLKSRTKAAEDARKIGPRAYRNHVRTEIETAAHAVVGLHRDRLAALESERRRRSGMPSSPRLVPIDPPVAVADAMNGKTSAQWLADRQQRSQELWQRLLTERDTQLQALGPLSPRLCMFASGSYGRDEAMEHSDIDMFLVDDVPSQLRERSGRLNRFERAGALTLIERTRVQLGIQGFSQSGYYQETQSFNSMLPQEDDRFREEPSLQTTTMALLMANSKCFFNEGLFHEMRSLATENYWRDHVGKRRRLRPTFLINDLRRMWLTMLVDYERFYPKDEVRGRRVSGPDRKIAGLKLTMPQQLGCYTPILAMLERSTNDGLLRTEAQAVLDMTTRERLDLLANSDDRQIAESAQALRDLYGQYLAFSWCTKEQMEDRVSVERYWPEIKAHFSKAHTLILVMLWSYHAKVPDVARLVLV